MILNKKGKLATNAKWRFAKNIGVEQTGKQYGKNTVVNGGRGHS